MTANAAQSRAIRQYMLVTGNYWAFTLTDGALRMLVVLYFHTLGYSPMAIAMLFLFYEAFGVVTNLFGGWLGARLGLNVTMNLGLFIQLVGLSMLLVPTEWLNVAWVMAAQALSGIAKDLNKMSAKSAVKTLVPNNEQSKLYKWVAVLTGSKNALKGVGFFLGGALLTGFGFTGAIGLLLLALSVVWLFSLVLLKDDLGRSNNKPKFHQLFSTSRTINYLSAARLFLFAARDVWFVVALPVYFAVELGWQHWQVGSFMALWIMGYGAVQSLAPQLTNNKTSDNTAKQLFVWAMLLCAIPVVIGLGLTYAWQQQTVVIAGILTFGVVFAVNSALHSYYIVRFARQDGVSLDVGFYYMANALGRLTGTILSGWVYQSYGLTLCLWISAGMIALAAVLSLNIAEPQSETGQV